MNSTEPYVHWIHCNKCYQLYIKKEVSFYLLACKHVICSLCAIELPQSINGPRAYKCPVCSQTTRACVIGNTMPKNLKDLFHPQPYLDGLDNYKIMSFQQEQRKKFFEHMYKLETRRTNLLQEIELAKQKTRQLFQNFEETKAERRQLQYVCQGLRLNKDSCASSTSSGYSSAANDRNLNEL
ncbi:RING finger protein vilya-like isoform X1 [Stomoxys calcitrans]|uniref:RING finger protein vilya-like isoform X1 n=2 Tax=Stomoxys calcitrans TaxID=35570 RepID=UPI0027E2C449|nr:RING finger protein vilya-like isoform X1 [Stomoxys calcitrans]